MKEQKKLLLVVLAIIAMMMFIVPTKVMAADTVTIECGDEKFAAMLASELKRNNPDDVEYTEGSKTVTVPSSVIENTTTLNLSSEYQMTSVKGIGQFKNLEILSFGGCRTVTDGSWSEIGELSKLKQLSVSNCNIGDSIKDILKATGLTNLSAQQCGITDITGIGKLKNLESVNLTYNSIDDLSELATIESLKGENGIVWEHAYLQHQEITYKYNASESEGETVTFSLPDYLAEQLKYHEGHADIYGDEPDITITVSPDTCKIDVTDNGTTITAPVSDLKAGNVAVTVGGLGGGNIKMSVRPLADSKINIEYVENSNADFSAEITYGDQDENGNVKVTVTANKDIKSIVDSNSDITWMINGKTATATIPAETKGTVTVYSVDNDAVNLDYETEKNKFKVVDVKQEQTDGNKVKVTIITNKEIDPDKLPEGWAVDPNNPKAVYKIMDAGAEEDVTLYSKDGDELTYKVKADGNQSDKFKVEDVKQEKTDGNKVKVTIITNKEIDPDKLPSGWAIDPNNPKAVYKIMDAGAEEIVTLYSKDGEKLTYKVKADGKENDNKKNEADTNLAKAGESKVMIIAIVALASVVIGFGIRYSKYSQIK